LHLGGCLLFLLRQDHTIVRRLGSRLDEETFGWCSTSWSFSTDDLLDLLDLSVICLDQSLEEVEIVSSCLVS
jgi:hypothetical protein